MPDTSRASTVSIVIPVYYNEDSLAPLAKELLAVEQQLAEDGVTLELIFVDDGSGDASLDRIMAIREARPTTKVVKLTRNFGAVAASKTGMQFATGDSVVILAADLQDPMDLLPEAVRRWQQGSKFVICSRATRRDPMTSRFFSSIYYRVVGKLIIADYPAGGFDMMLMDKELTQQVAGCAPNTNIHLFAYWLGYAPTVLEYDRPSRLHGRSRWTVAKKLKLFTDTMTGFSVFPIRAISIFGLLVAVLSFTYGAVVFIGALRDNIAVPGFATIAVMISFFFGLILVMLGLIGEYLWRIFDNTNRKPEAVVDEIHL
jgi:polyisoprenyl-phosphate glycosyltransferase